LHAEVAALLLEQQATITSLGVINEALNAQWLDGLARIDRLTAERDELTDALGKLLAEVDHDELSCYYGDLHEAMVKARSSTPTPTDTACERGDDCPFPEWCCRTCGRHTMPHKGCILR